MGNPIPPQPKKSNKLMGKSEITREIFIFLCVNCEYQVLSDKCDFIF